MRRDPRHSAKADDDQQRRRPDHEFELRRMVSPGLYVASLFDARYFHAKKIVGTITGTMISSISTVDRMIKDKPCAQLYGVAGRIEHNHATRQQRQRGEQRQSRNRAEKRGNCLA